MSAYPRFQGRSLDEKRRDGASFGRFWEVVSDLVHRFGPLFTALVVPRGCTFVFVGSA
ncbi:protein of unknown function [Pseudomonas sp. JV241A]|nr:protein of unknown function [Pseudomonas sp. JV241A]